MIGEASAYSGAIHGKTEKPKNSFNLWGQIPHTPSEKQNPETRAQESEPRNMPGERTRKPEL